MDLCCNCCCGWCKKRESLNDIISDTVIILHEALSEKHLDQPLDHDATYITAKEISQITPNQIEQLAIQELSEITTTNVDLQPKLEAIQDDGTDNEQTKINSIKLMDIPEANVLIHQQLLSPGNGESFRSPTPTVTPVRLTKSLSSITDGEEDYKRTQSLGLFLHPGELKSKSGDSLTDTGRVSSTHILRPRGPRSDPVTGLTSATSSSCSSTYSCKLNTHWPEHVPPNGKSKSKSVNKLPSLFEVGDTDNN